MCAMQLLPPGLSGPSACISLHVRGRRSTTPAIISIQKTLLLLLSLFSFLLLFGERTRATSVRPPKPRNMQMSQLCHNDFAARAFVRGYDDERNGGAAQLSGKIFSSFSVPSVGGEQN